MHARPSWPTAEETAPRAGAGRRADRRRGPGRAVEAIETQAKRDAALLVRDIEAEARRRPRAAGPHIVILAIQRVASEQTAETVVTVLHLPSDDMKGRIIGREGRNIRAFESVTGVNLIIDDTPEAVLLSCFDPVRREVGRLTLEKLVLDGRIHPHRIEEVYERGRGTRSSELCVRAAEDALVEVGITDMHPELVDAARAGCATAPATGRTCSSTSSSPRTSPASWPPSCGLDIALVKRCAFLHDIGKALTHEVEGSHALIGAELARKYGEPEDVVHAIEAHHNEVEPRTIEAVLTQAADARSAAAGRVPGARASSPTSSGWSASRRSPRPSRAWRRSSRCRPAARSG